MVLVMFASKLVGGRPVKGSRAGARATGARSTAATTSRTWTSRGTRRARSGPAVKTFANLGGRLSTIGPGIPTTLYGRVLSGPYKLPNVYAEVTGVYTNTTFVDAYRGAGRRRPPTSSSGRWTSSRGSSTSTGRGPAAELPAARQFPYENRPACYRGNGSKLSIDSGTTSRPWTRRSRWPATDLAAKKTEARSRGKLLGHRPVDLHRGVRRRPVEVDRRVGEGWGAAMWESSNIRVHLTGKVVVTMGTQPRARATRRQTPRSQPRAGHPMDDIVVQHSDTQGRRSAMARTAPGRPTWHGRGPQGGGQNPREGEAIRGAHARGHVDDIEVDAPSTGSRARPTRRRRSRRSRSRSTSRSTCRRA